MLVHEVPADDDGAGGEAAHGDEADAQVLDVEVVMDGQEDGETGRGDEETEEDEGEAEAEAVGEVGEDEAEAQGSGGGGDGVELGLDSRVAESLDDGGGEIGVGWFATLVCLILGDGVKERTVYGDDDAWM